WDGRVDFDDGSFGLLFTDTPGFQGGAWATARFAWDGTAQSGAIPVLATGEQNGFSLFTRYDAGFAVVTGVAEPDHSDARYTLLHGGRSRIQVFDASLAESRPPVTFASGVAVGTVQLSTHELAAVTVSLSSDRAPLHLYVLSPMLTPVADFDLP